MSLAGLDALNVVRLSAAILLYMLSCPFLIQNIESLKVLNDTKKNPEIG